VSKTEPIAVTSFQNVMRYEPMETHWITKPKKNPYTAVVYQFCGSYDHIYEGELYHFTEGNVMLYHGNDIFEVFEREHGYCIAAHFYTAEPADLHFTILDGSAIPQIKADFLRLYKAYNRRDEYSWYECTSMLYSILGKVLRYTDSGGYIQHRRYANIIRARDYLAENFNDPTLSIDAAAAVAGVSTRRFGELFRRLYHVTPGNYITRLRISSAEDMLRMHSYTVAEIAAAVGYTSPGYFCRVFTQENGIPPSRFTELEGDR